MKLKLTESQYNSLLKYINEARQAPVPTNLSGFFGKNKNTAFFTIVKLTIKTKDESEYIFSYENLQGFHKVTDINYGTVTKGCDTNANLDTMIYGDEFGLKFQSCGKTLKINNVVGIRLFDENKNLLDEMKFDNVSTADVENLADKYNDELKSLNNGDEAFFNTPTKKYDGDVFNKSSDKLEIEIHEHGKDNNMLLYVNMDSDGFYVENGNLFFKATKKNAAKGTETPFSTPIKSFSSSNSDVRKPEVNDPNKPAENGDKANAKDWETPEEDEEMKAKAKATYDAILADKDLQKAFYRKPSFWNLLTAELKGEKAMGRGMVPTMQIVGSYKSKKLDAKLKGDFVEGQQIYFYINQLTPLIITDDKGKELTRFEPNQPYNGKVKRFSITDDNRELQNKQVGGGFDVIIKSPTDKENVFITDIIKYVKSKQGDTSGTATDVELRFDPNSNGYKPIKSNTPTK